MNKANIQNNTVCDISSFQTYFQTVHFWGYDIFFLRSGYPINSIIQCQYIFIIWSIFSLNYQNVYDHQIFQSGDLLSGALTHKYAWHHNADLA